MWKVYVYCHPSCLPPEVKEGGKSCHDNTEDTSQGTFMSKIQSSSFWNIVDQVYAEFKYLQNHRFNIDNVFCGVFLI